MEDALYAMMLASANEVAYAICEHFGGGDYEAGVAMLNAKAAELGCTDTNFVNPNGIFDENHHTTTHDMALIAQAAYKYDAFQKIISTKQYTIKKTEQTDEDRTFQNHHKMLWSTSDYYYEYCTGGKTGYTSEALNTLVTFAEKDGRRLLCVTMKTRGKDTYKDTAKILDYGFDNFQTLSISQNETASIFSQVCNGTYVTIPADASFQDLVYTTAATSDTSIQLNYTFNGYSVGTGVARVDEAKSGDVEIGESFDSGSSKPLGSLQKRLSSILHTLRHKMENMRKEYLIVCVGALIIILILIHLLLSARRRAKARKKRLKNRRKRRS
jgi:D-alanyl-D-alanine carboxypeptidase